MESILTHVKAFSSFVFLTVGHLVWNFLCPATQEERFLYPVYSLITLLAAILLSKLTIGLKNFALKPIYRVFQLGFIFIYCRCVQFRILNLVENYGAPLQTFNTVAQLRTWANHCSLNKCVHGERMVPFPASFFYRIPIDYDLLTVALMAYYLEIF